MLSILADCISSLDWELWVECWNQSMATINSLFIAGAIAQVILFGRKFLRGVQQANRYQ